MSLPRKRKRRQHEGKGRELKLELNKIKASPSVKLRCGRFERCVSMDQKRYLVLSHMMIYALDNLHTDSIVMNQTTRALNRNIEKLLQERHKDKQKISSMKFEMKRLQLKNIAASMKVNKLLDEIGSLKKNLLENQAIVPDLNASTKEDLEEDEPPKEDPDKDDKLKSIHMTKILLLRIQFKKMQLKMMWLWRIQNKGMQLKMIWLWMI
ncbi:hypothetical protein C1H46_006454 [Malus baccata]|uniref:Uncharacterized protein n=1 Tax=Malus baccata TaxID=106549 RepID=A0A540NA43_MALBA|nr:hypothetical protein C1H46_006454 [Malus baccata]